MGWLTHYTDKRPLVSRGIDTPRFLSAAGFTLTEIMTALVVFSLGLVGLSSMQVTTIKLNGAAHFKTQIATVAQEQMEELLSLPFYERIDAPPGAPQTVTHPYLQDSILAVDKGTTRCVLYPPEGLRECTEKDFKSAYPAKTGRNYCNVTIQPPKGTNCSDTRFPPPTVGYKVQWTVNGDDFGNPQELAPKLAYIDLTVSQKIEGKTYKLSFVKASPKLGQ